MVPAIAAALITGGTSLLGGILGRNAKPSRIDYKALVRDAKAAGINPLTALGAGGGAGYARYTDPALSSGAFIAEALQRGADTYFNTQSQYDAIAAETRLREAAMAAQRQVDYAVPRSSFGYDMQTVVPGQPGSYTGPAPESSSDASSAPPVIPVPFGGFFSLNHAPGWRDAESVSTAYGDVMGELYGMAKMSADIGQTYVAPVLGAASAVWSNLRMPEFSTQAYSPEGKKLRWVPGVGWQ